jgi:hypothetical protein
MNEINKVSEIRKRLLAYEDRNAVHCAMVKRQRKLKALVTAHGIGNVCLAGGYAASTLNQYINMSSPNIGKENLDKAVHILKNL